MMTLAERIRGLTNKAVDASKPIAERLRLLTDTISGIPKAAGDLAISSAQKTGQGLGMIADSMDFSGDIPKFIGINDDKAQMTRAIPVPQVDPTGMVGSTARVGKEIVQNAPKAFEGFQDLSTKLLEKLKGRTTVSRQFISDLTNSPDLKQAEKDLVRKALEDAGDEINVPDFANRVKSELLPLERKGTGSTDSPSSAGSRRTGYENIALPDELRGPVANYSEHIYESPISTSAGSVHFGNDSTNYFAHSRIEDLPNSAVSKSIALGEPVEDIAASGGTTRRVIEIQSDLFQKGRLEGEGFKTGNRSEMMKSMSPSDQKTYKEAMDKAPLHTGGKDWYEVMDKLEVKYKDVIAKSRAEEVAKLEPYRNTWHERVIREEVKQAAKDGKTKLQFPTGETAMKIEGLGSTNTFTWKDATLRPEMLKVGREVNQGANLGNGWIITDVLGDGKFKAVKKDWLERRMDSMSTSREATIQEADEIGRTETFDISGKVDTENPIFKFYEKTVAKYLTNKYGGKVVTDPQGVKWVEIDVKPEYKGLPVEAFGLGAIPMLDQDGSELDNK